MQITAYNPSTDNLEKSYLTQDYAAGVTSVKVRNSDRFTTNDKLLLGEMGTESAEIVSLSVINADKQTLTVGATKFPHSADDPVYVLRYNQIKVYRSTTTSGGSYSLLDTVDVDVDNADKKTYYDDASGLTSYYYKITYYNSVTATESSFSDPIAGSGYDRSQVGAVINDFFTEVDDLEQNYMTVPQAISALNEVRDDLSSQSRRPYRFQKASDTLSIVAENDRVALPADLQNFDRILYNYDFQGENRKDLIRMVDMQEMEYMKYDQTALTDNNLQYLAIDETTNELVLYPTPTDDQADVFKIFYWAKIPAVTGLGDTLPTPSPRIYKLFLLGRHWRRRAVKEPNFLQQSDRYIQEYNSEVVKLQRSNRLDIGTSPGMRPGFPDSKGLRKY